MPCTSYYCAGLTCTERRQGAEEFCSTQLTRHSSAVAFLYVSSCLPWVRRLGAFWPTLALWPHRRTSRSSSDSSGPDTSTSYSTACHTRAVSRDWSCEDAFFSHNHSPTNGSAYGAAYAIKELVTDHNPLDRVHLILTEWSTK